MKLVYSTAMVLAFAWTSCASAKLGDQDDSVAETIRTTKGLHAVKHMTAGGARTHDFDVNGARIRMQVNAAGKVCEVITSGPNAAHYIEELLHTNQHNEFLQKSDTPPSPPAHLAAQRTRLHARQTRTTQNLEITVDRHGTTHRVAIKLRDADCAGGS